MKQYSPSKAGGMIPELFRKVIAERAEKMKKDHGIDSTINFDPTSANCASTDSVDGQPVPKQKGPLLFLFHELGHAYDFDTGRLPIDPKDPSTPPRFPRLKDHPDIRPPWLEEQNGVQFENYLRNLLHLSLRDKYDGYPLPQPTTKGFPVTIAP